MPEGQNTVGPAKRPLPAHIVRTRLMAKLGQAVWDASQMLSSDDIRNHVEGTIREIESDEP